MGGEYADALVQVVVCRGLADRVVMANCLTRVPSRNQRMTRTACLKQLRARVPVRVPRRSRSACSSRETNSTVSSRTVNVAVYATLMATRNPYEVDLFAPRGAGVRTR
jgi:hypothetical protein